MKRLIRTLIKEEGIEEGIEELFYPSNKAKTSLNKRLIRKSEFFNSVKYKENTVFEIYENPNQEEIQDITGEFGGIRGMVYPDGTIYVWSGDVIHRIMSTLNSGLDMDNGCRFNYEPGWGFDFDFNRRFNEDEAKEYIKQFEPYLNKISLLQSNNLHLWGIEGKGKGPFDYTYDELFGKTLDEV